MHTRPVLHFAKVWFKQKKSFEHSLRRYDWSICKKRITTALLGKDEILFLSIVIFDIEVPVATDVMRSLPILLEPVFFDTGRLFSKIV